MLGHDSIPMVRGMKVEWLWFGAAGLIWVAFGAALSLSAGDLSSLWSWVTDQTISVQLLMWVALLPWMAALAVWETAWNAWLRIVAVGGISVLNLYMFFPRSR